MKPLQYGILTGLLTLLSFTGFALPTLSSYPQASAVVYLDFDGHQVNSVVWNNGVPFLAQPGTFTDAQIRETFSRVAEDFKPFDLNITTDLSVFQAAPLNKRIRVVVTSTSAWYPGVGGVAYIGSFTWGDDTPAFVFADRLGPFSPKMVAECISHETGHTLGLNHQSSYDANCNLTEVYNMGAGVGEIGWAPIMGNSYYRNMTGWFNGKLPYGCSYQEDNLQIITTYNGFSYRPDDYENALNTSAYTLAGLSYKLTGIISNSLDVDVFRINLAQRYALLINARPVSIDGLGTGANLDVKLRLHASNGTLLRVVDPTNSLKASLDTVLPAGSYYIVVEGAGNANTSSYGSIGEYEFSGTLAGVLPIRSAILELQNPTAPAVNWNITSSEPLTSLVLEGSVNGQQFMRMGDLPVQAQANGYRFQAGTNRYFRIHITNLRGEEAYTNTVYLRTEKRIKLIQPAIAHMPIQVVLPEPCTYRVLDARGAEVRRGQLLAGVQTIPMEQLAAGSYFLQVNMAGEINAWPIQKR
jgi:hypothetical protein